MVQKKISSLAILLLSLPLLLTPLPSFGQVNSWSKRQPMPTPRWYGSASVVDGKVFVIGGGTTIHGSILETPMLGTVEIYDPGNDSWRAGAPMPTPRSHLTTVVHDGRIWAIAGTVGPPDWQPIGAVEVYDPTADAWVSKASVPNPVFEPDAVLLEGKIYLMGGLNGSWEGQSRVQVLDPGTGTWSVTTSLPTARGALAAAVVGGKIYAAGGIPSGGLPALPVVEAFDPHLSEWPPMPTGRSHLSLDYCGGLLIATGGTLSDPDISQAVVEAFDPVTGKWQSGTELPVGVQTHMSAVVGEELFLFGGITEGPPWVVVAVAFSGRVTR